MPFSSCPQSFQASGSFQMSQLFESGGQSIGVSASTSVLNEHPGLSSFRMDWLDFLAVQGTLKSLLQHHSSNASILRCSAFFIVQFAQPYMTTGKTIALTRWIFVGKVMLKILPARLQQYVHHELPDVQAGFRKGRGTRDQIANIYWIIEKARDRKSTRLNSSHRHTSRMPSSA